MREKTIRLAGMDEYGRWIVHEGDKLTLIKKDMLEKCREAEWEEGGKMMLEYCKKRMKEEYTIVATKGGPFDGIHYVVVEREESSHEDTI